MKRCHLVCLLPLLVVMPVHAVEWLEEDDQVARFNVCFDFGCKSSRQIDLFESDWRAVRALFANSTSAEHERGRIGQAIAVMESIIGMLSPTGADRAGNDVPDTDRHGQMDCIDESTNATTYLQLFQDQGLLNWHQVRERVYRAPMVIDQHWAAQIEDVQSGSRYAVDSWPRAHAVPAVIQAVEQWREKREPAIVPVAGAESKVVVGVPGSTPPANLMRVHLE